MNKELQRIIELTNEMLKIPSSICHETPFLNYCKEKAETLGYETNLKEKSYLVIKPKQDNSTLLFSAHIDRHALIQNEENKIEYLAFYLRKKLNLPFPRDDKEKREQEIIEQIKKTNPQFEISSDKTFLLIKEKGKQIAKFVLHSGAELFEKGALRHTRESITSYNEQTGEKLNTYKTIRNSFDHIKKDITYLLNKTHSKEDNIFMFNSQIEDDENYVSAQIDNVISTAVLFYLLETTQFNQEIILTTQEEIGNSWKCIEDYINTQENYTNNLVVLDTSPYPNLENQELGFLTLRHGDERNGFNEELVKHIQNLLEESSIPYDFKPSYLGNTELGKLALETKGKINGTTLQLPTMNYHTTYETATKKSLENYYKIVRELSK